MTQQTVEPMKKVELSLTVHDSSGIGGEPKSFSFILGLASEGLTPFEKEIAGLSVGESIRIQPAVSGLKQFFGAQYLPVCQALDSSAFTTPLLISVEVVAITDPEPREVVRQMATHSGGCGCGGGCGCS